MDWSLFWLILLQAVIAGFGLAIPLAVLAGAVTGAIARSWFAQKTAGDTVTHTCQLGTVTDQFTELEPAVRFNSGTQL